MCADVGLQEATNHAPIGVFCFAASGLKKSTLFLLRARVTFTPSSRNANSAGGGRKSGITRRSPNGSSVYFVLALIEESSKSGAVGSARRQFAGVYQIGEL